MRFAQEFQGSLLRLSRPFPLLFQHPLFIKHPPPKKSPLGNAQASPKRTAWNRARRDFFFHEHVTRISSKFHRINGTELYSYLGDIDCGIQDMTLSARWLVINYSYRFLLSLSPPSLLFPRTTLDLSFYNSRVVYACADTSRLITDEREKQSEFASSTVVYVSNR